MPYIGEILALASGLVWAGAAIFFRLSGRTVPPLGLNLFKNTLGFALLTLTMVLTGQALFPRLPASDYLLALASGAVGVAASDTLYFVSLNALGASLAAVVATLYVPFTVGLSLAFLGESLSLWQTVGIVLILIAIFLISYQREDRSLPKKSLLTGILAGVAAQLTTAVSIIIIKPKLGAWPLLWVTNTRVAGGFLSLAALFLVLPRRKILLEPLARKANWKFMIPATVLGTYLSILVWMGGMKYTQVSVAAALSQLSAVFIFILAILFLKEKPTPLRVAAVLLAVAGAILTSAAR